MHKNYKPLGGLVNSVIDVYKRQGICNLNIDLNKIKFEHNKIKLNQYGNGMCELWICYSDNNSSSNTCLLYTSDGRVHKVEEAMQKAQEAVHKRFVMEQAARTKAVSYTHLTNKGGERYSRVSSRCS